MTPVLDDLLNDGRLARLFSMDSRHCALQLWVLQIQYGQSIENRIIYGRLLPYSHSSDHWSSPEDDNFYSFGRMKAQIIRLNLYIKSTRCADLLRQLSAGRNIEEISQPLNLRLSDQQKTKFGTTALVISDLAYRPVAYLLNRDAHDQHSPASPHGDAGALSASIVQTNKGALLCLGQDFDVALVTLIVKNLNEDTGLNFGGADTTRFGDLELLVFPALDDLERHMMSVSWTNAPRALVARFNPVQVPYFSDFQFHLIIANDGQIAYSGIAEAERDANGVFECRFELTDQLHARTDNTELEVFGFHEEHARESTLCCRWRVYYVREIVLQSHTAGLGLNPVRFDWLERTTRPNASARVKAALTINRSNLGFTSRIGGREADPWVPANHELACLFSKLHPPKSEARFFLRWGEGDGEGRLQFVEWFKVLLTKYQQHQVVIFDPYFEAAGLGLVLLCAAPTADYIVFRSIPKPTKEKNPLRRKSDKIASEGINNLMANCEQSRHLLKRIKLRIYGLKEGRLHDRYILIMGPDTLPIAGFTLSNSFQTAAQKQPLLITPIPADVLLKVEKYKSELLREAAQPAVETESSSLPLLFDSTASPAAPRRYERLLFLENVHAGDVMSVWTGEPLLQGLTGDPLREKMAVLGLFKDDSLALPAAASLCNSLAPQAGDFADFTETWEVLGNLLAHSHTEDRHFCELESEHSFLEFLARFLEASFSRVHDEAEKELGVTDTRLFQESVDSLLHSAYRPHHFSHATKYATLSWPEYFTIKFLWWYASDALLAIVETQVTCLPIEPQGTDAVRLSLLSQIVSEIAQSVQFDISEEQRNRLVRSRNGLLQWMGLNAIEMQLEKPGELATVLKLAAAFTYPDRVRALGWMVHHAAGNPNKFEIYEGLVAALHEALPATIPSKDLGYLVNSMRGHMLQLTWAEPWLFQDVVFPLLQGERASTDDACEIWIQELAALLKPGPKDQPPLFDRAREGQTTNIAAYLFAYSSPARQQASLKSMRDILKQQQRTVQQPLASTSNWTRWDRALVVSLWLFSFTRWGQYYLRERGVNNHDLEELSRGARELAMVRPMDEWRSEGTGKPGELAAFLDHVDELLASSDKSNSELQ